MSGRNVDPRHSVRSDVRSPVSQEDWGWWVGEDPVPGLDPGTTADMMSLQALLEKISNVDLLCGPLSYDEVLREKGIVGAPGMVVDRLTELRETAGIDGVSAEINPCSMLSHAQVMASLRLWCREVMPAVQVTGRRPVPRLKPAGRNPC
jgi:hypothetical protein